MPRKTPTWKDAMPEFNEAIASAESSEQIKVACLQIKQAVFDSYPDTPNSRRNPMSSIRKAVRDKYPAQSGKSPHEDVPFPYYFTDTGKGGVERWEHLAIFYLVEDWNLKDDLSDTISPVPSEEEQSENITRVPMNESSIDIFSEVGLEGEELAAVKQAPWGC